MTRRLALWLALLVLPTVAHAQALIPTGPVNVITVQDSGTACATAGTCVAFNVGPIPSFALGVTITGSPTLTVECTTDGGTWTALLVSNMATGTQATTITAAGNYSATNPGCRQVRARGTTISSATATVTGTAGYGTAVKNNSSGADSLATYLVASASHAPANAVNVGPLANKVIGGATPSAITVTSAYVDGSILTTGAAVTVAQGGTSLQTLTAHDVYVGNGTSAPTAIAGGSFCTLTWSASSSDPTCAVHAVTHTQPSDKTGTATTGTYVMNGLACAITPTATGNVLFTITGYLTQTVVADGTNFHLAYGTGTAPVNGAAATGTNLTAATNGTYYGSTALTSFTLSAAQTGLTVNTAYWFDVAFNSGVGGTSAIHAVDCTATEI